MVVGVYHSLISRISGYYLCSSTAALGPIIRPVARGFGLLSLIASLAIGGVVISSQLGQRSKPATPQQNRVIAQANAAAASVTALQAERQMAVYQAEHGTFEGASVSGIAGATLLRADASGFCLQLTTASGVLYDAGPGGTPTAQHC
jgi:hypothetical protein